MLPSVVCAGGTVVLEQVSVNTLFNPQRSLLRPFTAGFASPEFSRCDILFTFFASFLIVE